VKASDADLLAAAARAGLSVTAAPGVAEVIAASGENFFDVLAAGTAANLRSFEPEKRTEQVRAAPARDLQLLAAAHAVAAYWLSASRVGIAEANPAAHGGEASLPHDASPPVTITVNHVTPDGGLAGVELVHPDLGALALEVSLSGNTLSVLATAETEHAAAAIREGQAALAMQLRGQGITLQAVTVVVLRRRVKPQDLKSKRQES
jgi:Flagellar hook-length control protein FliK